MLRLGRALSFVRFGEGLVKTRRVFPLWFAGLLALAALAPGASANDEDFAAEVTAAVNFRTLFGLQADRSYAEEVARDPSATRRLGAPLTASEAAEIDRRAAFAARLDPVIERLDADARFAGAWINQRAGGRLEVSVAREAAAVKESIMGLMPSDGEVNVTTTAYSKADLEATRATVEASWSKLVARGIPIRSVWINHVTSQVEVGLADLSQAAAISDLFGPSVSTALEEGGSLVACSRANCANPMKGGLYIYVTGGPACTSAFMGRKTTAAAPPNEWYIITAGHCFDGTAAGADWKHADVVQGDEGADAFITGGVTASDSGVIKMRAWDTPTNQVLTTVVSSITSKRTNGVQLVGNAVCRAGASSNNYDCGTIYRRDVRVDIGSNTFSTLGRSRMRR